MDSKAKERKLPDILSEQQLNYIVKQNLKAGSQLLKYEIRPATADMSGFLGDHFKVTLNIKEEDNVKKMHLFVKTKPTINGPKTQFIDELKFFIRENLIYEIFGDLPDKEFSGSMPWGVKSFIHNDNMLVLPDLSVEGYKTYPGTKFFDLEHVLVALTSLARFHAAFAKHETQVRGENSYYIFPEKYACFFKDPQFFVCPWLRTTIKVTTNFLKEFSSNINQYPIDLEESMTKWFTDACASLRDYDNTLNVLIHKDLWANNILFKYQNTQPVNGVLIDFQCPRYAPPAIDIILFLYYNTSKVFREHHETEMLNHYYSVFSESIDKPTRLRLADLNYNRQAFLDLCETLRPSGMIVPLSIAPFILMAPLTAQEAFDNPQTFHEHFMVDRSGPVLRFARENEYYKSRLLEMFEEFVGKHLV